ncbi:hypothetical protein B0H10DRAFT_2213615 [Mycena sp. CBHHK59/15]|nr:hypothetical protein B0H10DRAFT_2213615 [Mycena sp. CBHHK59/15]
MSQFTFRAYVPPTEPTEPPPSHSWPIPPRSQFTTSSSTPFRQYIPPGAPQEPEIFSHAVPPPVPPSSSFTYKTFTPPPMISSYAKRGSYQSDVESGKYTLSWTSLVDLHAWLRAEEATKTIELILKEEEPNRGTTEHQWTKNHIHVCARMGTGGKSRYIATGKQERKIGSKRTSCPCRLVAKTYPGTTTILGRYENNHSHLIGSQNLIYTRIPAVARAGVRPEIVHELVAMYLHTEKNLLDLMSQAPRREEFIRRRDVRRAEKRIEAKNIRLDPHDGKSTLQWVDHFRAIDALMFVKSSSNPPPLDSDVDAGSFLLAIQTPYQRKCFRAWGRDFAGLDAAHHSTYYAGMLLFAVIVRDRHGHGMHIAWLIASNGQADTIDYFLM